MTNKPSGGEVGLTERAARALGGPLVGFHHGEPWLWTDMVPFDPLHNLNHAKLCTDEVERMGYLWETHLNASGKYVTLWRLLGGRPGEVDGSTQGATVCESWCRMLLAVKEK